MFLCASCSRHAEKQRSVSSAGDLTIAQCDGIVFTDITTAAGITWRHCNGAFGQMYFPEIKGSGCAVIDYNNDGWPDLLLVNSMHWPGHLAAQEPTMALYRNNRDGTFTDVTKEAGLAVPMFGMGATVGDYDNDGWDDLFVTAYGHDHLFHNRCVFTDVTARAGVAGDSEWHTSAMFLDSTTTANWICLCVPIADGRLPTTCFFHWGGVRKHTALPRVSRAHESFVP